MDIFFMLCFHVLHPIINIKVKYIFLIHEKTQMAILET